jgi:AraC-like DNA-binding protein
MMALEGGTAVLLDDRVVKVGSGQGLLIHPYQFHRFLTPGHGILWLLLTFELDGDERLDRMRNRPFPLQETMSPRVERILRLFGEEHCERSILALTLEVATLLAELPEGKDGELSQTLRPAEGDGDRALVSRAAAHVAGRLHEPIPVGELAAHLQVSVSFLQKCFRRTLGLGVGGYVRRMRVHRAAAALRLNRDQSVSEVAARFGFDSLYSFSRTFKQVMGQSPSAYRGGRKR